MATEAVTRGRPGAIRRLRELAGVLLYDYRRYSRALAAPGLDWLALANRYERLDPAPDGVGFCPRWEWTSRLHAPKVVPRLGRRLLERALRDFPVSFADEPTAKQSSLPPLASVVIGHRGTERLPLLEMVLHSLAAQEDVTFECILVEQASAPVVRAGLPAWVRYIHTPPPDSDMPYSRSWAFNVGARLARGELLVFHDNDLIVPMSYLSSVASKYAQGYEVVNLKRFLFYLSRKETGRLVSEHGLPAKMVPEMILQNAEAGGSVAIGREPFFEIGGFNEDFIGWGGEDNELWERAQTLRVYPFGSLPLLHLWHSSQPGKRALRGKGLATADLSEALRKIPASKRIAELTRRNFGDPSSPHLRPLSQASGAKWNAAH